MTTAEDIDKQYPEHAKLAKIADKSQAIGEFLEWLQGEQGYSICEYDTSLVTIQHGERAQGGYNSLHRSIQSWLAQYFQIDPVQIDREKRAMLDGMRALHDDEVANA